MYERKCGERRFPQTRTSCSKTSGRRNCCEKIQALVWGVVLNAVTHLYALTPQECQHPLTKQYSIKLCLRVSYNLGHCHNLHITMSMIKESHSIEKKTKYTMTK